MTEYHKVNLILDKSIIDILNSELKTDEKISYSISKTNRLFFTTYFVNFFMKKQLILSVVFEQNNRILNNIMLDENTKKTILMLNPIKTIFKCIKSHLDIDRGNEEKNKIIQRIQEALNKINIQ